LYAFLFSLMLQYKNLLFLHMCYCAVEWAVFTAKFLSNSTASTNTTDVLWLPMRSYRKFFTHIKAKFRCHATCSSELRLYIVTRCWNLIKTFLKLPL
jgi:hypothetical protein